MKVLQDVAVVAAEDTRVTLKLLSHLGIKGKPLVSCHEHSGPSVVHTLLGRLQRGESIAMVSDAGTPLVSDPGRELVAACSDHGVPVVPVPGPSAVAAAVSISGLVGASGFTFSGFFPRRAAARAAVARWLAVEPRPVVFFESPKRVQDAVAFLSTHLPHRPVCIARELTKVHEEVFRGTLTAANLWLQRAQILGEFTLVLGGVGPIAGAASGDASDEDVGSEDGSSDALDSEPEGLATVEEGVTLVAGLLATAPHLKAPGAIKIVVATTGLPRDLLYRAWCQVLASNPSTK